MIQIQFKTKKDAIDGFYTLTFNGGFIGFPDYVCLIKREQLKDLRAERIKFRVVEEAQKHERKQDRSFGPSMKGTKFCCRSGIMIKHL